MTSFRLLVSIVVLSAGGSVFGGDWPTWRHDAGRGGSTPEALPAKLHEQWVRSLPLPRPAWPASQPKLQFDRAYEPIVMGHRLFVGSSVDDSIAAYDTRTGAELWRFFTDGPVRFAPVATERRVYAVSDDGHLYALEAETGEIVWKVNGGPAERTVIGNDRLVSSWPARGGVVLADGVLYFAASIWPSMGIFVHAVDAESGRVLWTNSEVGSLFTVHPHGASSFGSVVPQGYFTVAGDYLIAPGGRSLPAVFDRHTGRLVHFDFGGKSGGGYWAMARGEHYVVGEQLFRLADGVQLAGVFADLATDTEFTGVAGRNLVVQSLDGQTQQAPIIDRRGRVSKSATFTPHSKRSFELDEVPRDLYCRAGSRLYFGDDGEVVAVNLDQLADGQSLKAEWTAKVEGAPVTMLAADDRLFVATDTAKLYCFGGDAVEVTHHEPPRESLNAADDEWTTAARTFLAHGKAAEGYAIALGIGSGRLIEELLQQTQLHVIAVDPDAKRVEQFRRRMHRAGLYGVRTAAHVGDPANFPFPPYLAHLIVSEAPQQSLDIQHVFRALRPYGGAFFIRLDENEHAAWAEKIASARLAGAKIARHDEWSVVQRVGALPGASDWTHQYGDAGNSVVSKDQLVRAPLGLLWFGGPSNDKVLPRHGHGPSPQVAGGRLVIEGPDMLRAVDVYTGRVHWEKDLPGVGDYYNVTRHFSGAGEVGSNYVTQPDHVYVIYGNRILELDAATGETTKTFELDAAESDTAPAWGFLAVDEDLLIATSSPVSLKDTASNDTGQPTIPTGFVPLVPPNDRWQYLAGTDPKEEWTGLDFPASGWKLGTAGFGYGDGDDRTTFKDMHDRYGRVYIRKTFDGSAAKNAEELALAVRYDDAFVAYLNGQEIVRAGVGEGSGAKAAKISSHEAKGYETFTIKDFRKLLKPDQNVLALEGHNTSLGSSDFSLDPYLLVRSPQSSETRVADISAAKQPPRVADVLRPAEKASSSRRLIVFDRHTGRELWHRDARHSFRHNAIAVAAGKVFCIDGLSPDQYQTLKRRGIESSGQSRLLALDVRTGREVWSTSEDVFGTFLNYSAEHDVLLQAGSAYRDRAADEVGTGMVAYRGQTGEVLWKDLTISYNGPCLLWRDKIITNGSKGFQLELLTGERTGWEFSRMYGCNTVLGSEHLLTFRSGAAGFCDLTGDSGTGNLGGFRSSCTSNLIPADGVLNAPDYTRTCTCAYQNQTSVAWVHMPEAETWTFSTLNELPDERRFGINLGAPGDRRDEAGTLWYEFPRTGGPSPDLGVKLRPENPTWFRRHASLLSGEGLTWVAASGGEGIREVSVTVPEAAAESEIWTVRLHFSEPADTQPGERVFSVALQGETVRERLDVAAEVTTNDDTVVQEFRDVRPAKVLTIALQPLPGSREPILCGVEVVGHSADSK